MRRILIPLLLLMGGAGCRDSADALARDYRNLNNEALDALMMINGEAQAKNMLECVFKWYPVRLRSVDDRCKNWKQNNEKEDYGSQIYTSDSVVILLIENDMNQERLTLEKDRLKKLLADMTEAERDARRQAGDANADINPKVLWPSLAIVVEGNADVDTIKQQLDRGSEVISVQKELGKDERFLKSGKMKELKERFEKKVEDFKQNRMRKFSP